MGRMLESGKFEIFASKMVLAQILLIFVYLLLKDQKRGADSLT